MIYIDCFNAQRDLIFSLKTDKLDLNHIANIQGQRQITSL